MKLVLVRHLWGVDLSEGYAKHSKHWHEIGYTALEGSSRFVPDADLLHRTIRDEGFQWIPQVFSNMQQGGGTVKQHLDSLREQIEECLNYEPLFFNGHTGADHWILSEAEDFYNAVNEMECKYGVPIFHETHRSRYLGNPWSACRLLEIIPALKLTCDFSHWVCVAERLLADTDSVIQKAVCCCHHIHARVGYEQGPQVPDPRDPAWADHLQAHERWWEMAWTAALARNLDWLTLTPEFGPPPYLHTLPFSGEPVGDLEEICDWMAVRQSRNFALWDKNATHRSDPGQQRMAQMTMEGDLFLAPVTNRGASPKILPSIYLLLITAVAAIGGLLFGYDTAVISGAIDFVQKHFSLSAVGAGWAASSALVGCVIGAAFVGFGGDAIGRRAVLIVSAVLFLISAIGAAFAQTFAGFVAFRLLAGVGVGAASMTSPLYIAEISPTAWRGRLVAVNQLAIVSGMLLIYFVNYSIAVHGNQIWNENTGWRWMFASGILPSTLLLVSLFFVPETPRFLAAKGRHQEAALVLLQTGGDASFQETGSAGSLKTAPIPRILGIGVSLAILQQITGINVFLYYAPQIFSHVGGSTNSALLQTVLVGAVNLLFTAIAMATVDRIGRKPLMIAGAFGMGCCLIAMGSAAMAENTGVWLLTFVLGYIACFALSVGPVTWIILTEIFPMSVRNQALAIATTALWLANFAVSQTFPMLDQSIVLTARFHHGFPFFFYAIFCVIEVFFVWRLLPETKDRTLEEIGVSWSIRKGF